MADRISFRLRDATTGAALVGAAIGPALAGWIFDMSGSYNWSFVTAAACMTTVGLLVFLARKEKF